MNWISLAIRNLFRNTRRSVTTVAAVALGYAAINIFGGFANYMFASIQDGHIYEQLNGHVQIWTNISGIVLSRAALLPGPSGKSPKISPKVR